MDTTIEQDTVDKVVKEVLQNVQQYTVIYRIQTVQQNTQYSQDTNCTTGYTKVVDELLQPLQSNQL